MFTPYGKGNLMSAFMRVILLLTVLLNSVLLNSNILAQVIDDTESFCPLN